MTQAMNAELTNSMAESSVMNWDHVAVISGRQHLLVSRTCGFIAVHVFEVHLTFEVLNRLVNKGVSVRYTRESVRCFV